MRRALPATVVSALTAGLLLAGAPANAAPAAEPAGPVSTYTSVSPVRVLDTRSGTGTGGTTTPVGPGGTITLDLTARVPATATAVVLNVTGVDPTANTFVSIYPTGQPRATASSLNLAPGDTRPNQVTVALGTNHSVNLFNNAGTTHLAADFAGYYAPGAGAKFTALSPNRLLDTRNTGGPLGPGAVRVLDLTNRIPASATAVTVNLTGTDTTASTYVTAFPTGTTLPNASNLNIPPRDTRANLVTVAVGTGRKVSLFNNAGSTNLIVDLTGFYTRDYGASFVPLNPTRVLDTRTGTGTDGAKLPVTAGEILSLDLTNDLPANSTAAVFNITGVNATAPTFVASWPQYENRPAAASTLNLSAGQTVPNAAVVALARTRGVYLFNNAGSVHLIADLAGVFTVSEDACTTGCVYAWGENTSRKLGTGEPVFDSGTPTQVAGLSGVRAVDGGARNGYALRTDGTVWAWGSNDDGQLGNGWTSDGTGGWSAVPVPVTGLTGVTAIAAGGATAFALRSDGTVWAWGAGTQGVLGNGAFADSSAPVQVSGLTNVVRIANNGATGYAVRGDGTVWSWGANASGALGNGSTTAFSLVPVQVSNMTGATDVAAGGNNGYAHRSDGSVWAWGANTEGQLGNGTTVTHSTVPVRVANLNAITAIGAGRYNGYAVKNDGSVWAWGAGSDGANGDDNPCTNIEFPCASTVPVEVSGLTDATTVASFEYGGLALRTGGAVAGWGFNGYQTLANQDAYWTALTPVPAQGVTGVSAIGTGEYSAFAVVPNP